MGTSVDHDYIGQLQEDIKSRCGKLEEHGYDSLVVMVCKDIKKPFITGSLRGTVFLETKDVFISEFRWFCTGDGYSSMPITEENKSFTQTEKSTKPFSIPVESLDTPVAPTELEHDMFDDDTDEYDDTQLFDPIISLADIKTEVEENSTEDIDHRNNSKSPEADSGSRTGKRKKSDHVGKNKGIGTQKNLPEVKIMLTKLKDNKSATTDTSIVYEEETDAHMEESEDTKIKIFSSNNDISIPVDAPVDDLECHFCLRVFDAQDSLDNHIIYKHERNTRNIKCQACGKSCESSIALGDHLAKEHKSFAKTGKDSFKCGQCSFVFSFKTHLVEHNQRTPDCKALTDSQSKSDELKNDTLQTEITFTDPVTGEVRTETAKQLMNNTAKPNTCQICLKQFELPYSFRRHIFHHSTAKHYKCIVCLYEFNIEENMKRHWKLHDAKPFYCSKCFERYETRARLNHHVNISCKYISVKPELQCPQCEYQGKSRHHLEIHCRSHTEARDFSCEICGKQLRSKGSLKRHYEAIHQDNTPFECYECGKKYKTKDGLTKHSQTHGERKFKCHVCSYCATDAGNLKKHMQTHTKEKPYICDFCGNSYARKFGLVNHRYLHTGERPFKCDFEGCEKAFRNPVQLKQHKCSHSTTYAYVCDFCGRKFKVENAYRHHRRYHTVEFRWPCEYCEEKFRSRMRYKSHIIRAHLEKTKEIESKTNIRFFQCSMCPKICAAREHLIEHVNTHQGLKPVKCRICGKGFSSKGNMMQHEKSHMGGKKFRCGHCPKTYNSAEIFKEHLEKKHAELVDLETLVELGKKNMENMKKHEPLLRKFKKESTSTPEKNEFGVLQLPSEAATSQVETYEATRFIHPGFQQVVGEMNKLE